MPDVIPRPSCDADCAGNAARLADLLRADDLDAAIESGLMAFIACPHCARHGDLAEAHARIAAAQQRLRDAWAARDRHRAREARLQRRVAERAARRSPTTATDTPALPPAAAAALARAKARVARKP
jgi:Na+-translocating ferredoxin:NAD+ oxidoreductase RnfC subunit